MHTRQTATAPSPRTPAPATRGVAQRAASAGGGRAGPISSQTAGAIEAARGGGAPLDPSARGPMEASFGVDFSAVRVHADRRAAGLAADLGARAFTVGSDIFFADGQLDPRSAPGRRLLAHELTHVRQQVPGLAQRACDPAALAGRTAPVWFPQETTIMAVFGGARTLSEGQSEPEAIGQMQQALTDLGYDIGAHGPRHDGVDGNFGTDTKSGLQTFQTAEAVTGASAGVLDQPTLRCLDETRSRRDVPAHQTGVVAASQLQITGQRTGGRDEDIYFERGLATLDAGDIAKIGRLTTAHQGCALRLEGFISEDEKVAFGPTLATDRINAVEAAFAAAGHDDPGPVCTAPTPPLRTPVPRPDDSAATIDYRSVRKVEVVGPGATSTTPACPVGAAQFRPPDATESPVLTMAIDDGLAMIDAALGELSPGDPEGDDALTRYFGGTSARATVVSKLTTWRDHLDVNVRANHQVGTGCNPTCTTAIAYNNGRGASAMMTVCPRFFTGFDIGPFVTTDTDRRAATLVHEAGHGSIGTADRAYSWSRLTEYLDAYPSIALINTDSYVLTVLCLSGHAAACSPSPPTDTFVGLSTPADQEAARRGVAWLQSWLMFSGQDVNGAYKEIDRARNGGAWTNTYYSQNVLNLLISAFDLRMPPGGGLPSFSAQTTVAAIYDRLRGMANATRDALTIEQDSSAPPNPHWQLGTGTRPGDHLYLDAAYFALSSDRDRVRTLLPYIIAATPAIDAGLRTAYETFVREDIRVNRGDQP